ncbi:hypothetical protein D3C86_2200620 [compost metagenome]
MTKERRSEQIPVFASHADLQGNKGPAMFFPIPYHQQAKHPVSSDTNRATTERLMIDKVSNLL